MKKLTEIYGLNEGPFDDVQNQLNRSQSVLGGPTTSGNVRKHQDRAKRWDRDVAKAQSDIDSAKSVFGEATGEKQVSLTDHEIGMIMGWAGEYRENEGAQELLDKLEAAMNDGMTSSSSHTSMKRTPFG